MTEEHVNFITYNSVPKAMTLEEIEVATNQDNTLRGLRAAIKLNKWHYDIVKPFKSIKDELRLIREKISFPNIDKMVKDTIDRCIACQAVSTTPPQEPLTVTEMPKGPWDTIHVDFYGPLPTGEYLIVAIDRH